MSHEIDRVLDMVASGIWLIEPDKAAQIAAFLALRASGSAPDWAEAPRPAIYASESHAGRNGPVHVLQLHGTITPRAGMMSKMSGGASMEMFQRAFSDAASDASAQAIVIDIDSPGGMVDLVPETAAMIYAARNASRPIIAVANTMAASAAYWIAAAADEIVVTPSGSVGSIGVYTTHENMAEALKARGITRTLISEGPRKTEGHPFGPLTDEARAATQARVRDTYEAFTTDVARFRGVSVAVVRADPEAGDQHFGGGRYYNAKMAVKLGMADRAATLNETLLRAGSSRRSRSVGMARKRLAMI